MGKKEIIIKVDTENLNSLNIISKKYPLWYIDGTLYNSGSGLNFSCAGLKADCLAVSFKVEKEDWLNSEQINIFYTENWSEHILPNNMRILINKEFKSSLLTEDESRILKIIMLDDSCEPPSFYLLLK